MARGRNMSLGLAMAAALALGGCQQTNSGLGGSQGLTTASTAPVSFGATAELGKKWQADSSNVNKGLAYANALESTGQGDKQLAVYASLYQSNPENSKLAALYGKKLVSNGKSNAAIPVLEAAAKAPDADWRVHSALGSAYDQQGLYQKARQSYQQALASGRDNLTVLNNMGMSFALEGDLKQAEATFRQADALPRSRSEPRIRQNLALVVGLQGRFDEASQLASEDLPPDQVEANMAYLQKMLAQPNTWQQLSGNAGG
jgi:Flp pilus assembly protein TadD